LSLLFVDTDVYVYCNEW